MDRRQSPGWQFSTLFLVKDSLAVMLESAHLYEDALREYSELEACYLEALAAGGPLSQQPFGQLPACPSSWSTCWEALRRLRSCLLWRSSTRLQWQGCQEEQISTQLVQLAVHQMSVAPLRLQSGCRKFLLKSATRAGDSVAGGNGPGEDAAQLLSATWRETRHAVLETGMVPQFQFRQFLFACQARILMKLNRHIEVCFTGVQAKCLQNSVTCADGSFCDLL